jgi:hypothetical protein
MVLPTSFIFDASHAYITSPRIYTPEMVLVRQRIAETTIRTVALAHIAENHYTAFVYHLGSPYIEYGDSMHGSPPSDILTILQWIFEGTSSVPITKIVNGTISKQGLGNGEGSCGIACYNYIELATNARPGLRPWTGAEASLFRDAALEDFIRIHHLAHQAGSIMAHVNLFMSNSSSTSNEVGVPTSATVLIGYNDYNMYNAKVCFEKTSSE